MLRWEEAKAAAGVGGRQQAGVVLHQAFDPRGRLEGGARAIGELGPQIPLITRTRDFQNFVGISESEVGAAF